MKNEQALRDAFRAGMVAKDSGAAFDEASDWFDAYIEDEAALAKTRREAVTVELGDRFIYTHNGAYVEVTRLFGGRWKYAELRIVDCGSMFNSDILVHELQDNKYGFWEKTL